MSERAGKSDLAKYVAEEEYIPLTKAEKEVNHVLKAIHKALVVKGGLCIIGDFTIEVKEYAERQGVNPTTKETISIPARKRLRISTGATLLKELNQ